VEWTRWLVTAVGAAVVVLALRDVFHTLWHPSGQGGVTRWLMRSVWAVSRPRSGRRRGALAGPIAMGVVLVAWLCLVVAGFALVYAPWMAEAFVLGSGLDAAERGGFVDALYLSLVTVATLGFGDIVPADGWLRVVTPLQALVGFALLTAAVTWVLQVYPALIRRRVLAVRLSLLHRSRRDALLEDPHSVVAAPLLENLAAEVVRLRVDITQYSETYYFREEDEEASLAATLGVAVDLARAGRTAPRADVRVAAELLGHALEDYALVLDRLFLHRGGSVADIVGAYADDHGYARRPAGD
jgi:hypothetical protein